MFNIYLITTVLIFLCILIIAGLLAYRTHLIFCQIPTIEEKFKKKSYLIFNFVMSWMAYIMSLSGTIIAFYFGANIAGFILLLVSINPFLSWIFEKFVKKYFPKLAEKRIVPTNNKKVRIYYILGSFLVAFTIAMILCVDMTSAIFGNYLKNNEPQVYLNCIKEKAEKSDDKIKLFPQNLSNCNKLEEKQKVYKEFIEEAHECKNLYPENKYIKFFDWLGEIIIRPSFEIDFYNQKHENKCK